MRKTVFIVMCLAATSIIAQTKDITIQQKLENVKTQLNEFDTEHLLDSLDQEALPRLVSGGVLAGANLSNFIITRDHHSMSSYMRIGGEIGGFLDFRISKHFSIQPQVIFTAQQNYFAATDTTNTLWSFGAEIPVYFLGRFGNMEKGYVQFGGGIFTHFTFASNVKDKFKNWDDPTTVKPKTDTHDYSELYSLHDNHFGICAMVGYEFRFGLQINASYRVSLSDIATFYKNNKGQEIADALIYPQSVSLNLGYRWK
ncbi:MAG: PorT family protein [Paludibacteraceae bacterium]|nr:PorT family protein [Paludibacteraceae bacterium]